MSWMSVFCMIRVEHPLFKAAQSELQISREQNKMRKIEKHDLDLATEAM